MTPLARTLVHVAAVLVVALSAAAGTDQEIAFMAVLKRSQGVGWGSVRAAFDIHCSDMQTQRCLLGDDTRLFSYELRAGHTTGQVQDTISDLVATGVLVFGEANYTAHSVTGQTGSLWVSDVGIGATQYHNQYAGQLLGINAAHQRSQGQGITVAMLDSGVDPTHEAVGGPLSTFQWDLVGNDATPLDEGDGIDNDGDGVIDDGVGHGTYVTSLVRLIAPKSRLMHIRILNDEGNCDAFMLAAGIELAVAHGADIINISASTTFNSAAVADAVANAKDAGIIVVAAIGNGAVAVPMQLEYPAALSTSFAICATGPLDTKASFSNWGTAVDFAMPGWSPTHAGGVYQADTSVLGAVPGEGYAHWSGTSLSAAIMSGAAAVVRAQYPNLTLPANEVPDFVMGKISTTSTSIDALNPQYAGLLGAGRPNIAAATLLGPLAPRPGDVNADGLVDSTDLSIILAGWGACQNDACLGDVDGNTVVDALDLNVLFSTW